MWAEKESERAKLRLEQETARDMEKEAKRFDYSVLDKAVENSVKINVDEIVDDIKSIGQVETVSDISSNEYVIIDIRQDDACIETSCETLKIPFYKLKNEVFFKWIDLTWLCKQIEWNFFEWPNQLRGRRKTRSY